MENIFGSNHFNAIGPYLKKEFGCRTVKLSLDGGFTCPNRDGTLSREGCAFCSADGAGRFASTVPDQIQLLQKKWPDANYLAYFQNHTNTYAPVSTLARLYDEALSFPKVAGLAIATRPDCLPPPVLDLLSDYNEKTYLWVELGLQTIHETTAVRMNRCYPLETFSVAMAELKKRNIKTVVHLILGLPGESPEDMLSSVDYVGALHPFGVKLHLLHVLKNTKLSRLYPASFSTLSQEEYIALAVDALERLPQDITIHRITGDAPKDELISPLWSLNKRLVLNQIQREFKNRGSYQGSRLMTFDGND